MKPLRAFKRQWTNGGWRVRMAVVLMVFCLINWPLSLFTYAKQEQPVILSLSWAALAYGALGAMFAAETKEGQDSD